MTEKSTDTAKEADSAATVEQPVIDDTIITAGSLTRALKKCRAAADMDLRQAADEMRLPMHVLKALEAEEFADLPEPPYIRGYLRSYSRLNDSDPNELIRRYEVLRGANPDDITSFSPSVPNNRNTSKPSVSPATVKLAGLALMVLVLGVLSMIPAVSQWVTETWSSFSEPSAEEQLAGTAGNEQNTAGEQGNSNDNSTGTGSTNTVNRNQNTNGDNNDNNGNNAASSNNDTATTTNEQLALNNQDNAATDTEEQSGASDSTEDTAGSTGNESGDSSGDNADGGASAAEDSGQDTAATEETKTPTQAENIAIMEAADKAEEERKKAEEEAAAQKLAEEKKKAEEEAEKLAEEKKKAEEEEAARKLAEEEEAKKLAEAEAAKKAEAQKKKDDFKQPIDGTVDIQLVFSESVWMSIKDAKGKNIFASLNTRGTRKQLKARTPLSFRVGNAPGVKIYLNGQLVNQVPYTRGSVSTFRVN